MTQPNDVADGEEGAKEPEPEAADGRVERPSEPEAVGTRVEAADGEEAEASPEAADGEEAEASDGEEAEAASEASPEASPERSPEASPEASPAGRLVGFVTAQPLLSLFFVLMVVASPFAIVEIQARTRAAHLAAALNEWEQDLGRAGLPVPFLPPAEVALPSSLRGVTRQAYDDVGLGDRYALLLGWRELLAGRPLGQSPPSAGWEADGLGAALVTCDRYRQVALLPTPPAELLLRAGSLAGRSPEPFRQTLELVGDLFGGRNQQVIHQVEGSLGSAHPACVRPLEVLRVEATRRRVVAVLSLRPPTGENLEELVAYVGATSLDMGALLEARAFELPLLLRGGGEDLGRARALLRLLLAVYPQGLSGDSPLLEAWAALAEPIGAALGTRLSRPGADVDEAIEVIALAGRLDQVVVSELVPIETFANWRGQLQEVVDDRQRLTDFACRFFELGWSPAGLEELLLRSPEPAPKGDSPGTLFFASLVAGGGVDWPARQAELDAMLSRRVDSCARRIRARFAHLRGRETLGAGRAEEAGRLLEEAAELGFEPKYQLLRARAQCALALGDAKSAQALGREALKSLEFHAARVRNALPTDLVAWELQGYPVHPNLVDPVRADLHLDLAALLAGSAPDEAAELCGRAEQLDPRNPKRLLIQARLLARQGRKAEARKVVFDGLRGLRGAEQETLRKQLRDLLRELGPN